MINEQTLDIIIAVYQTIVAVFFGVAWRKRKDLIYWFIGLVVFSIGSI